MKILKLLVLTMVLVSGTCLAGHMRSDGMGGYYTPDGHIRSDGMGGYYTPDGHVRSDGMGGYYY